MADKIFTDEIRERIESDLALYGNCSLKIIGGRPVFDTVKIPVPIVTDEPFMCIACGHSAVHNVGDRCTRCEGLRQHKN